MKISIITITLAIFATTLFAQVNSDETTGVTLPKKFSSNMVLQRDKPVRIWGDALEGIEVIVEINNINTKAIADSSGKWFVILPSQPAGGPYELRIISNDTIRFSNVMFGDVWVCSGQSNMNMPVNGWTKINNAEVETANADHPQIRLLQVGAKYNYKEEKDINSAGWKVCSPETIEEFSAAAYFFGREINKTQNVPVGLIHSSWGGTKIESWMNAEALGKFEDYDEILNAIDNRTLEDDTKEMARVTQSLQTWYEDVWQNDSIKYYKQFAEKSNYQKMNLPGYWETQGYENFDGVVWFKKTIELSEEFVKSGCNICLGKINDCDITYVNGVKSGGLNSYLETRNYFIDNTLLKSGRNEIIVRVLDTRNNGGFWGRKENMKIESVETNETVSLYGEWDYFIGLNIDEVSPRPKYPRFHEQPAVLYNGMISPLVDFGIKGFIWYQGESNANDAYRYRGLFPALINNWRGKWNDKDLPFLFVQLANFRQRNEQPVESDWAELREAQLMTLNVPSTGMAVTIDIGDANDIHPKNKQDVGKRLALLARDIVYDEEIESMGPIYKSYRIEKNKVRLFFDHVGGGLKSSDPDTLKGFAIAGQDKKFYWAEAKIDGNTIIVSSDSVTNPEAVRYGWSSNPDCTLINSSNLPASPFRTDDQAGITRK